MAQPRHASGGNPYDFRSPIRSQLLLAGRETELGQIDALLRESVAGRPAHFSLFGLKGSGKSSLLNSVTALATHRGLLGVKVPLREATVETELDFYRTLYDSALQVLLDDCLLNADHPTFQAWQSQAYAGDLSAAIPNGLELGTLVAAKANGRMTGAIPTALVKRDLKRLLSLPKDEIRGLVLCLDSAERLDDNIDLAPSLLQLADATPLLTLVTAAESVGRLQSLAPRAWAQIAVEPFSDPGDVLDAITKPLAYADDALRAEPPTPDTAVDILHLTGGVPYEVNLVCHFIWDAIQQGEQGGFELSSTVIQRVTQELEEKGRHQASDAVATFSSLPTSDYELLVNLAPYEALTTRQIALVRLMLTDFDPEAIQEGEEDVRRELSHLANRGVLRVEQDRFEILGGADARLYLKYAAKRHTGRKLQYGDSYARAATVQCARLLGRELTGDGFEEACLFARGRPHELGGSSVGVWLQALIDAASTRNVVTLSHLLAPGLSPQRVLETSDSIVLVGLQLQTGLHDVEHLELLANVTNRPIEELRSAAEQWVITKADLLAKYDIAVVELRCEEIPLEIVQVALAYWLLEVICQASYIVYRMGAAEAAEELITGVLETIEKLVGANPTDPLVRTQLANALHRHGFMAATRGDWDNALARLERSRTTALIDEWLLNYNLAYVRASLGDRAQAAELATAALEQLDDTPTVLLHAYFPTPPTWEAPNDRWNVVELQGNWVRRFLEVQLLVLGAETTSDFSQLEEVLGELSSASPPPITRLAAWASLTLLRRPEEAVRFFDLASLASPYADHAVSQIERAFAEASCAPGQVMPEI